MGCVIHQLPGRIRIRTDALKERPDSAKRLVEELARSFGVASVKWNAVTGSLLVKYDPEKLAAGAIIDKARARGLIDNVFGFPKKFPTATYRTPSAPRIEAKAADLARLSNPRGWQPSPELKRLAGTALKIALPIVIERLLGRSAARLTEALL